MKKFTSLFLLVTYVAMTNGVSPFKPRDGSVPFIAYFMSRYRGLCVGTLVSRSTVLTAAVCVTHPLIVTKDTRPINMIMGTSYRHPRRGIRVQVTKILIPKWANASVNLGYLMQRSPAILLLKRQVPDVLAEVPIRGIEVDYDKHASLNLYEECATFGWHYFFKGDKIYPKNRFLLQKNLRVQFLNIAIKHMWCDTLAVKYENALINLGFMGYTDKGAYMCIRDPDRTAQPCHGMYGAPFVCRGKVAGMLMAPDAQWSNCTGFSNLIHVFKSSFLQNYWNCVKGRGYEQCVYLIVSDTFAHNDVTRIKIVYTAPHCACGLETLFVPEFNMDWELMKKSFYKDVDKEEYDYLPEMYDKIHSGSSEDD